MSNIRDIRQRISSVKEIQHITRAMKMVSVAKLHRMDNAVRRSSVYRDIVEEIFAFLFSKLPRFNHPFFEKRAGATLVIAIASDKGLCGGYNSNVMKKAAAVVTEGGAGTKLMVVGKRLLNMTRAHGIRIDEGLAGYSSGAQTAYARVIAQKALKLYEGGEVTRVAAVVHAYKREKERGVIEETLLPMKKPEPEKRPERANYLCEPRLDMLAHELIKIAFERRVYGLLLEAQQSEHLARMQSMENASKNAKDLIAELTLVYNKARQSIITSELLDIIGGAEALK